MKLFSMVLIAAGLLVIFVKLRNARSIPIAWSTTIEKAITRRAFVTPRRRLGNSYEIDLLREIFWKLHKLEEFPEILPLARNFLTQLLTDASVAADGKEDNFPILRLKAFSRRALGVLIKARDQDTASKFELYSARRARGGPKELFGDIKEAELWLRQQAPVKCVDGAWLCHLNRVTVPFSHRLPVRQAFQVLLEELGDGNRNRHHVVLFQQLMRSLDLNFPNPDTLDFIDPVHQLGSLKSWKAAVAQLLISLFSRQCLPEVLGFNLHFEAVTEGTLKGIRELKELNLDPTYFLLHVCIDNADTGHTAMAYEAVCTYLEEVEAVSGPKEADRQWRRVQQGYCLSEQLAIDGSNVVELSSRSIRTDVPEDLSRQVAEMFRKKIDTAGNIHCACQGRIGGRSIAEWLNSANTAGKDWELSFIEEMRKSRHWIKPGCALQSRFTRELLWGGRMFGAFTDNEFNTIRKWIDQMAPWPHDVLAHSAPDEDVLPRTDITTSYPVFESEAETEKRREHVLSVQLPKSMHELLYPLPTPRPAVWRDISPLWFTHICLLENFLSTPYMASTSMAESVIRILRALSGIGQVIETVGGTDEMARSDKPDMVDVGLEMTRACKMPAFTSLEEVLACNTHPLVLDMLHLSMRPSKNQGLLLGMAAAFVSLQNAVTSWDGLSWRSRNYLKHAIEVERTEFETCFALLAEDSREAKGYYCGFFYVKRILEQISLADSNSQRSY